jgi:hypothetical protein
MPEKFIESLKKNNQFVDVNDDNSNIDSVEKAPSATTDEDELERHVLSIINETLGKLTGL